MADEFTFDLMTSSSSVPADCKYGITLERSLSRYDVPGRAQAWRMRVLVTKWHAIDPNIMVYRAGTVDPVTGDRSDEFVAIASPVDLEELPAGEYTVGQEPPFYRLAELDLISRNQTQLDETWKLIKADVEELVRSITYTCELTVEDEFTAGVYPEDEPVTPVAPDLSSSSSVPEVCPIDLIVRLKVVASDDPDFPVDTILFDAEEPQLMPDCSRRWMASGDYSDQLLVLTTSMINHTFTATLDAVPLASGGLADGYKAMFTYTRDLGSEYTIQVVGESA